MIRVVIIDDHFFVRMGLASSLREEDDLEVVAEGGTVAEAVAAYREHRPDVMLLDGILADGNGLEVIETVMGEDAEARLIMLSVEDSEVVVRRAREAGAITYLTKATPRKEILHAVREAAAGRSYLSKEVEEIVAQDASRERLTDRELDVLELLVKGEPNKLIADQLGIAESTVKVHLSRIFDKFGVQDRTSATTEALRRGLVTLG